MAGRTEAQRRVKMSITVDPEYAAWIDDYLKEHPELDRSKVIDQALALWCARQQDAAMAAQFAEPLTEDQAAEMADWREIRRAAAERMFSRHSRDV